MWDVVRGVVQGKLGAIKEETQNALEAEATNNYVKAFLLYRQALDVSDWEEEPLPAEVRISLSPFLTLSSTYILYTNDGRYLFPLSLSLLLILSLIFSSLKVVVSI